MSIYLIMLIAIIAPPIGIPLVFLSIIYIIGNHMCLAISIQPEEFDEPYDMETDIDDKVGACSESYGR